MSRICNEFVEYMGPYEIRVTPNGVFTFDTSKEVSRQGSESAVKRYPNLRTALQEIAIKMEEDDWDSLDDGRV